MGFQPILVGQCPTIALLEIREILISRYNTRLSKCHSEL